MEHIRNVRYTFPTDFPNGAKDLVTKVCFCNHCLNNSNPIFSAARRGAQSPFAIGEDQNPSVDPGTPTEHNEGHWEQNRWKCLKFICIGIDIVDFYCGFTIYFDH